MDIKSISILGLGLIGGSLAKAFRQLNSDLNIYAVDSCSQSLKLAKDEGVINKGFSKCSSDVWNSDIIFICTPVRKTIEFLEQLSDKVKPDCIITDVVSTKGELSHYIESLEKPPVFIGGHPMAGTEKSGYANSFAHLFENAYYVLTPTKASTKESVETLETLLKGIGALPIIVSAEEHDIVTGCISHVPHIIASALVNLAETTENSNGFVKLLAAGGFKDITRIASSNPAMWENIVISNAEIVTDLLNKYKKIIDEMLDNIQASDNEAIYHFFNKAKLFRDSFSTSTASTGLFPRSFELLVDVKDEPGIIGRIATLLGNNEINIKNINISNSREFEQGCLRITLPDQINTDKAYEILSDFSYKVFRKD